MLALSLNPGHRIVVTDSKTGERILMIKLSRNQAKIHPARLAFDASRRWAITREPEPTMTDEQQREYLGEKECRAKERYHG